MMQFFSWSMMLCTYHINPAGKLKVGRIIFCMSLNVTYSIIKPHIKELAHNIAEELNLQASQVNYVLVNVHYFLILACFYFSCWLLFVESILLIVK